MLLMSERMNKWMNEALVKTEMVLFFLWALKSSRFLSEFLKSYPIAPTLKLRLNEQLKARKEHLKPKRETRNRYPANCIWTDLNTLSDLSPSLREVFQGIKGVLTRFMAFSNFYSGKYAIGKTYYFVFRL